MPPDETPFDAVAWVNDLEEYLREAIGDLRDRDIADPRLTAIAVTQFELGCMALERAVEKDKA